MRKRKNDKKKETGLLNLVLYYVIIKRYGYLCASDMRGEKESKPFQETGIRCWRLAIQVCRHPLAKP